MSTPTFSINSGASIPGVQANWQRVEKRRTLAGIEYQAYALHTWEIAQMEMTTFETLRAARGTVLSSLATTAIADVNNGATYTNAEITVVSGSQTGRRATGVRVEFRVKI